MIIHLFASHDLASGQEPPSDPGLAVGDEIKVSLLADFGIPDGGFIRALYDYGGTVGIFLSLFFFRRRCADFLNRLPALF